MESLDLVEWWSTWSCSRHSLLVQYRLQERLSYMKHNAYIPTKTIGIVSMPFTYKSLEERFWPKVEKTPIGCWNWLASLNGHGYGQFHLSNSQNIAAHIFAYRLVKGNIPKGLELDHLCRNRKCVNPDHLEPVTRKENLIRGKTLVAQNLKRTHCPKGHPYSDENLTNWEKKQGKRSCKTCKNERMNTLNREKHERKWSRT